MLWTHGGVLALRYDHRHTYGGDSPADLSMAVMVAASVSLATSTSLTVPAAREFRNCLQRSGTQIVQVVPVVKLDHLSLRTKCSRWERVSPIAIQRPK